MVCMGCWSCAFRFVKVLPHMLYFQLMGLLFSDQMGDFHFRSIRKRHLAMAHALELKQSRAFSNETLAYGVRELSHQHVKVESPEERKAMEAELQDPILLKMDSGIPIYTSITQMFPSTMTLMNIMFDNKLSLVS